jgi:hypothetical protein
VSPVRIVPALAAVAVLALAVPPIVGFFELPPEGERFIEPVYIDGIGGLVVGTLVALAFVTSLRRALIVATLGAALVLTLFLVHVQAHEPSPGKCNDCLPLLGGGYVPAELDGALRNVVGWWAGALFGSLVSLAAHRLGAPREAAQSPGARAAGRNSGLLPG